MKKNVLLSSDNPDAFSKTSQISLITYVRGSYSTLTPFSESALQQRQIKRITKQRCIRCNIKMMSYESNRRLHFYPAELFTRFRFFPRVLPLTLDPLTSVFVLDGI